MKFTTSDKIIIGATLTTVAIAVWVHYETSRYVKGVEQMNYKLGDICSTLYRGERKIDSANRALEEGNDMLRQIILR